ncbi:hypothetical protein PANT111_270002 [Pantoea brenneri]|uniref:Uncharacterized protein n=1 Tax=Pantoea brenneri TaxID=472694 RepID=A0AAX3J993_9GAMM|nr:hypothetical protein PANT111_270002 [Pantoea brenneri]
MSELTPARRWGVSDCLSRRSRQGADARPFTIPASGGLRATLRAVPSSLPAADGPAGRAIRGAIRPFADFLSALLASGCSSALRTPLVKPSSVISLSCGRRTGRTRLPWRDPSFRRLPVGSPGLRSFLSAADASGETLPVSF